MFDSYFERKNENLLTFNIAHSPKRFLLISVAPNNFKI